MPIRSEESRYQPKKRTEKEKPSTDSVQPDPRPEKYGGQIQRRTAPLNTLASIKAGPDAPGARRPEAQAKGGMRPIMASRSGNRIEISNSTLIACTSVQ